MEYLRSCKYYRKIVFLITKIVITVFLCQNISWGKGISEESTILRKEALAAQSRIEQVAKEFIRYYDDAARGGQMIKPAPRLTEWDRRVLMRIMEEHEIPDQDREIVERILGEMLGIKPGRVEQKPNAGGGKITAGGISTKSGRRGEANLETVFICLSVMLFSYIALTTGMYFLPLFFIAVVIVLHRRYRQTAARLLQNIKAFWAEVASVKQNIAAPAAMTKQDGDIIYKIMKIGPIGRQDYRGAEVLGQQGIFGSAPGITEKVAETDPEDVFLGKTAARIVTAGEEKRECCYRVQAVAGNDNYLLDSELVFAGKGGEERRAAFHESLLEYVFLKDPAKGISVENIDFETEIIKTMSVRSYLRDKLRRTKDSERRAIAVQLEQVESYLQALRISYFIIEAGLAGFIYDKDSFFEDDTGHDIFISKLAGIEITPTDSVVPFQFRFVLRDQLNREYSRDVTIENLLLISFPQRRSRYADKSVTRLKIVPSWETEILKARFLMSLFRDKMSDEKAYPSREHPGCKPGDESASGWSGAQSRSNDVPQGRRQRDHELRSCQPVGLHGVDAGTVNERVTAEMRRLEDRILFCYLKQFYFFSMGGFIRMPSLMGIYDIQIRGGQVEVVYMNQSKKCLSLLDIGNDLADSYPRLIPAQKELVNGFLLDLSEFRLEAEGLKDRIVRLFEQDEEDQDMAPAGEPNSPAERRGRAPDSHIKSVARWVILPLLVVSQISFGFGELFLTKNAAMDSPSLREAPADPAEAGEKLQRRVIELAKTVPVKVLSLLSGTEDTAETETGNAQKNILDSGIGSAPAGDSAETGKELREEIIKMIEEIMGLSANMIARQENVLESGMMFVQDDQIKDGKVKESGELAAIVGNPGKFYKKNTLDENYLNLEPDYAEPLPGKFTGMTNEVVMLYPGNLLRDENTVIDRFSMRVSAENGEDLPYSIETERNGDQILIVSEQGEDSPGRVTIQYTLRYFSPRADYTPEQGLIDYYTQLPRGGEPSEEVIQKLRLDEIKELSFTAKVAAVRKIFSEHIKYAIDRETAAVFSKMPKNVFEKVFIEGDTNGNCEVINGVIGLQVFRAAGIPARAVSGYQDSDSDGRIYYFPGHMAVEIMNPETGNWQIEDLTKVTEIGDERFLMSATGNKPIDNLRYLVTRGYGIGIATYYSYHDDESGNETAGVDFQAREIGRAELERLLEIYEKEGVVISSSELQNILVNADSLREKHLLPDDLQDRVVLMSAEKLAENMVAGPENGDSGRKIIKALIKKDMETVLTPEEENQLKAYRKIESWISYAHERLPQLGSLSFLADYDQDAYISPAYADWLEAFIAFMEVSKEKRYDVELELISRLIACVEEIREEYYREGMSPKQAIDKLKEETGKALEDYFGFSGDPAQRYPAVYIYNGRIEPDYAGFMRDYCFYFYSEGNNQDSISQQAREFFSVFSVQRPPTFNMAATDGTPSLFYMRGRYPEIDFSGEDELEQYSKKSAELELYIYSGLRGFLDLTKAREKGSAGQRYAEIARIDISTGAITLKSRQQLDPVYEIDKMFVYGRFSLYFVDSGTFGIFSNADVLKNVNIFCYKRFREATLGKVSLPEIKYVGDFSRYQYAIRGIPIGLAEAAYYYPDFYQSIREVTVANSYAHADGKSSGRPLEVNLLMSNGVVLETIPPYLLGTHSSAFVSGMILQAARRQVLGASADGVAAAPITEAQRLELLEQVFNQPMPFFGDREARTRFLETVRPFLGENVGLYKAIVNHAHDKYHEHDSTQIVDEVSRFLFAVLGEEKEKYFAAKGGRSPENFCEFYYPFVSQPFWPQLYNFISEELTAYDLAELFTRIRNGEFLSRPLFFLLGLSSVDEVFSSERHMETVERILELLQENPDIFDIFRYGGLAQPAPRQGAGLNLDQLESRHISAISKGLYIDRNNPIYVLKLYNRYKERYLRGLTAVQGESVECHFSAVRMDEEYYRSAAKNTLDLLGKMDQETRDSEIAEWLSKADNAMKQGFQDDRERVFYLALLGPVMRDLGKVHRDKAEKLIREAYSGLSGDKKGRFIKDLYRYLDPQTRNFLIAGIIGEIEITEANYDEQMDRLAGQPWAGRYTAVDLFNINYLLNADCGGDQKEDMLLGRIIKKFRLWRQPRFFDLCSTLGYDDNFDVISRLLSLENAGIDTGFDFNELILSSFSTPYQQADYQQSASRRAFFAVAAETLRRLESPRGPAVSEEEREALKQKNEALKRSLLFAIYKCDEELMEKLSQIDTGFSPEEAYREINRLLPETKLGLFALIYSGEINYFRSPGDWSAENDDLRVLADKYLEGFILSMAAPDQAVKLKQGFSSGKLRMGRYSTGSDGYPVTINRGQAASLLIKSESGGQAAKAVREMIKKALENMECAEDEKLRRDTTGKWLKTGRQLGIDDAPGREFMKLAFEEPVSVDILRKATDILLKILMADGSISGFEVKTLLENIVLVLTVFKNMFGEENIEGIAKNKKLYGLAVLTAAYLCIRRLRRKRPDINEAQCLRLPRILPPAVNAVLAGQRIIGRSV